MFSAFTYIIVVHCQTRFDLLISIIMNCVAYSVLWENLTCSISAWFTSPGKSWKMHTKSSWKVLENHFQCSVRTLNKVTLIVSKVFRMWCVILPCLCVAAECWCGREGLSVVTRRRYRADCQLCWTEALSGNVVRWIDTFCTDEQQLHIMQASDRRAAYSTIITLSLRQTDRHTEWLSESWSNVMTWLLMTVCSTKGSCCAYVDRWIHSLSSCLRSHSDSNWSGSVQSSHIGSGRVVLDQNRFGSG